MVAFLVQQVDAREVGSFEEVVDELILDELVSKGQERGEIFRVGWNESG